MNKKLELPKDAEYDELDDVEKQIIATISARDIHVLTALAYGIGQTYAKYKENNTDDESNKEYHDGYVAALTEIYKGLIEHINELALKYKKYFDEKNEDPMANIEIFDHQNETPETTEETNE
jgi:hypothetical protein